MRPTQSHQSSAKAFRMGIRDVTEDVRFADTGSGGSDDANRLQWHDEQRQKGAEPRILVVDDDPAMRHMLVEYFEDHHLAATSAASRQDMFRALSNGEPRLILLDIKLGQDDGFDLLREIRNRSDVPVIVATGHRCDEVDRIVGLELGADDYVIKPFSLREVLARIRAVLRRNDIARSASKRETDKGGYKFAKWELQRRHRRLIDPNGETVALTKGEYALLVAFLDAPQRPLSREQLLNATRIHEDVFDRSIDVQVLRLRRKLEIDAATPRFIQTERGVGYVFAVAVETY
jgi:two-component system, OmpR family, response regulator